MTMYIEALHGDAYISSSQDNMFLVHQILQVMPCGDFELKCMLVHLCIHLKLKSLLSLR